MNVGVEDSLTARVRSLPVAIMPVLLGRGAGGANRSLLFPLVAVLLLSFGVAAIQEEQKAVQEQPQKEVKMYIIIPR